MRGKKVAGRKRHVLVDTLGLIWGLAVLPADVQDYDGAQEVFRRAGASLPRLARSGPTPCTGPSPAWVAAGLPPGCWSVRLRQNSPFVSLLPAPLANRLIE